MDSRSSGSRPLRSTALLECTLAITPQHNANGPPSNADLSLASGPRDQKPLQTPTSSIHQTHSSQDSTNRHRIMKAILNMRLQSQFFCLAAGGATLTTAQAVYGGSYGGSTSSVSTIPASISSASSVPVSSVSVSTISTTSAPVSVPAGNHTTHIMPMNCTSACTTVTEPCTESQVAPMPYGTGSWTPTPVPPPSTGDYSPPPASSGSWMFPSAPPSATSEAIASASAPAPYTGAAAGGDVVGGLVGLVGVFVGGLVF